MGVIDVDSTNRWIAPQLSTRKRGGRLEVKPSELVGKILYKLKSDCQEGTTACQKRFEEWILSWGRSVKAVSIIISDSFKTLPVL